LDREQAAVGRDRAVDVAVIELERVGELDVQDDARWPFVAGDRVGLERLARGLLDAAALAAEARAVGRARGDHAVVERVAHLAALAVGGGVAAAAAGAVEAVLGGGALVGDRAAGVAAVLAERADAAVAAVG